MGYCYPSGLEKTLCKWDVYVRLVTKGLNGQYTDISVSIFTMQAVRPVFVSLVGAGVYLKVKYPLTLAASTGTLH